MEEVSTRLLVLMIDDDLHSLRRRRRTCIHRKMLMQPDPCGRVDKKKNSAKAFAYDVVWIRRADSSTFDSCMDLELISERQKIPAMNRMGEHG